MLINIIPSASWTLQPTTSSLPSFFFLPPSSSSLPLLPPSLSFLPSLFFLSPSLPLLPPSLPFLPPPPSFLPPLSLTFPSSVSSLLPLLPFPETERERERAANSKQWSEIQVVPTLNSELSVENSLRASTYSLCSWTRSTHSLKWSAPAHSQLNTQTTIHHRGLSCQTPLR